MAAYGKRFTERGLAPDHVVFIGVDLPEGLSRAAGIMSSTVLAVDHVPRNH
ncbi:hypothetical protein ABFA25_08360 [Mycobacterium lepromatosis]|nr:hypothetical protein [Mycobacterium lepromatosis]